MCELCSTCENLDTDKFGFWCHCLRNVNRDDNKCPDYESKYKQLELNCEN